MANIRRVHRFRGHAVAGVNWRPTRLFDQLPSFRVCDLCRVIPKRTMVMPCSHVLCLTCHRASCEGVDGRCPMDGEPFVVAECSALVLPATKASSLKVSTELHCTSTAGTRPHGCEFVGAVEDILEHYDSECRFRAVECIRCGAAVLHRSLSSHYASGCTSGVLSKAEDSVSLESAATIVRDVQAALEKMNEILTNPDHDQLMPTVQSWMNELAQLMRERESRLAEFTREVAAPAEPERGQVAAAAAPKMEYQHRTRTRSETMEDFSAAASLGLPRPPFFENLPPDVLECHATDYPSRVSPTRLFRPPPTGREVYPVFDRALVVDVQLDGKSCSRAVPTYPKGLRR
ncbi:hypothetical protein MTO96_012256 [Rhipicephalus appendiculatus]